jgi:hypothetical protein
MVSLLLSLHFTAMRPCESYAATSRFSNQDLFILCGFTRILGAVKSLTRRRHCTPDSELWTRPQFSPGEIQEHLLQSPNAK